MNGCGRRPLARFASNHPLRGRAARDPALQERLLTFVLIGGGPTGVELAGPIAELAKATLARDFRHIEPRSARILLIQAGPRLLPSFPEKLSADAASALVRMGVSCVSTAWSSISTRRG
jgi:NADH:ubiquinone reductase (H+-translocating)